MTKQAQRTLSIALQFFFYGLILGLALFGFGACEPAEPPIYDPPPPTPEQAAAAAECTPMAKHQVTVCRSDGCHVAVVSARTCKDDPK